MKKLLAALLFLAGCDAEPLPPRPTRAPDLRDAPPPAPPPKHQHEAPHGGTLVELGEHFANLELVLDAVSGKLTAYVLDGHADQAIRLEQREIVLKLKDSTLSLQAVGSPLTGERPGDTSQFEGQSDSLKGQKEFDAKVVRIVVKGQDFQDVSFNFPKGN